MKFKNSKSSLHHTNINVRKTDNYFEPLHNSQLWVEDCEIISSVFVIIDIFYFRIRMLVAPMLVGRYRYNLKFNQIWFNRVSLFWLNRRNQIWGSVMLMLELLFCICKSNKFSSEHIEFLCSHKKWAKKGNLNENFLKISFVEIFSGII